MTSPNTIKKEPVLLPTMQSTAIGAVCGAVYGYWQRISIPHAALGGGVLFGVSRLASTVLNNAIVQMGEKYNWKQLSVVRICIATDSCVQIAFTTALLALGIISPTTTIISMATIVLGGAALLITTDVLAAAAHGA